MTEMNIRITTYSDMGDGVPYESRLCLCGAYHEEGDICSLSFSQEDEGCVTHTLLQFREGEREALSMRSEGGRTMTLHFAAKKTCRTAYTVDGAGTLYATAVTEEVRNTLGAAGGEIDLAYRMAFDGLTEIGIRFSLSATPKEA